MAKKKNKTVVQEKENNFDLHLFGHTIKVIVGDPSDWGENVDMGRSSIKNLTINVNKSMPNDIKCSTLLHEILHIVLDFQSMDLTEQQVDILTIGLFSLARDNIEILMHILETGDIDV